jgi:arylformamidase
VCGISGIYDLEPVRLSYLNEVLHLSASDAQQASPQLLAMPEGVKRAAVRRRRGVRRILRQRDFYAAALRQSGHAVEVVALPQQHHLSVVDVAADAGSELTQSMLRLILT